MSALITAYRELAAAHELLKGAHRGVARAVRRVGRGAMADFHRQEAGKARRLAERYRHCANALESAGASRPGAAPTGTSEVAS